MAVAIEPGTMKTLRSTQRWARLLAGLGWIGAVGTVLTTLQMRATGGGLPASTQVFALASSLVGGATFALAAVYLGRYARKLRALLDGHAPAAVGAFRALRVFWIGLTVTYAAAFLVSVVHLATELEALNAPAPGS